MTAKIKTWKVGQIMHDMSKFGDKYWVDIEGSSFGTFYADLADEEDMVTVTNIHEVIKETEKAVNVDIDGFKTWIPKSAIVF